MNPFGKNLVCLCFIIFMLAGCLNLKHPNYRTEYYTLEYEAPGMNCRTLPWVIGVQRLQVAPVYNTSRIVYRKEPYTRDSYFYHKWQANPGDLVTYFFMRDIRQSSAFKAIHTAGTELRPSHIVEGVVDEFYEDDHQEYWEAVLTVSITLLKNNEVDINKQVLFQKQYSRRETCSQKNPQALAKAMSKAMAGISEMIINDIYTHLANASQGS